MRQWLAETVFLLFCFLQSATDYEITIPNKPVSKTTKPLSLTLFRWFSWTARNFISLDEGLAETRNRFDYSDSLYSLESYQQK